MCFQLRREKSLSGDERCARLEDDEISFSLLSTLFTHTVPINSVFLSVPLLLLPDVDDHDDD